MNPQLIVALGTTAVNQARNAVRELNSVPGGIPGHVKIFGIDTMPQQSLDADIPFLDPSSFINLAAGPRQLQTRLRLALINPRNEVWLSKDVVRAAVGDGSGAMPAVARFYLEQAFLPLRTRLQSLLEPFRPAARGDLAARSNQHPWLQHHHATVSPAGPIEVVVVASTTGGTVGGLMYLILLLKRVLEELGMEANFRLVLTLPAVGGKPGVDLWRMQTMCGGRLHELLDAHHGRRFEWEAIEGVTLAYQGPFFDTVLVQSEPTAGDLAAHNRRTGRLLYHLVSPHLGGALRQTVVDMLAQFRSPGPLGQPKLLTLCGFSELYPTAVACPAEFAAVRLGLAAAEDPGPEAESTVRTEAQECLEKYALTLAAVRGNLPQLDRPQAAPPVPEAKTSAFLARERVRQKAERVQRGNRSRERWSESVGRFRSEVLDPQRGTLKTLIETRGPTAAAALMRQLMQGLHRLRDEVQGELGRVPAPVAATPGTALLQQLVAVADNEERVGVEVMLQATLDQAQSLLEELARYHARTEQAAGVLNAERQDCLRAGQAFDDRHTRPHALLDRAALQRLVDRRAAACVAETRKAVAAAVVEGHDAERLRGHLQEIVRQEAAGWARLEQFDEALLEAGATGERAVENAVAAAEPAVRLHPLWEPALHAACRLFATIPEQHPLQAVLQRGDRVVKCVAPASGESSVVVVSLDIGVEIGAVVAGREAVDAHLAHSLQGFSRFADKRFEPLHDLVIPPETEWLPELALPLHWHLDTGIVSLSTDGVWSFKGVEIGVSYDRAAEALVASLNRLSGLPSLSELRAETRRLLNDRPDPLALLADLEQSLSQQLADTGSEEGTSLAADPKFRSVVTRQRAVVRALSRQLLRRRADADRLRQSRGRGRIGDGPQDMPSNL